MRGGNTVAQDAASAKAADQRLAGRIRIVMVDVAKAVTRDKDIQFSRQLPVLRPEEGQVEMLAGGSPRDTTQGVS